MYLHDDVSLFEEVVLAVAAQFRMNETFVAKDYWATMMLSEVMRRNEILVFKGGTCLSKCYDAISRFSEDVDLGIPSEHATEGERKAIKHSIVESTQALGIEVSNLSETKSRREYNRYEIVVMKPARSLILETAIMTPASPYNIKPIQSIVGVFIESRDKNLADDLGLLPFEIRACSIERTLADKIFALCDCYLSGNMSFRQSRHIYDIYKLLDIVSLDEKVKSLIETVRTQRVGGYGNFSADTGIDLSKVLLEIVKKEFYKSDYERITMSLLYEDVCYSEAIGALRTLASFLKAN